MNGGVQLGLDFATTRLVRVTPSRLATWTDCPRRYRLTYLDRPSPPRSGGRAHSTLGAVVHLALRALFELPPAERTPRAAAALVDRHWTSEGFRDAAQAAEYRERARGWVAEYATEWSAGGASIDAEWSADSPDGQDVDVVGLEQWVSVATDRIVAEGRVDRIDRRGADLVVVDYKTGRWVPTAEDARSSQALALYAVATEHTLRRPCTQVELHHLPSGQVAAWEHDRASLSGHVRRAEETAAELAGAADELAAGGDAEELFPARPAARCGACEMRRSCPEGRAAAPERDPWALLAP
ncbi:PD-(D/E)XK nuclease family protein [Pseudonocardia xinjiangensis]|uniref:PD-(D/E)XK nuclease family protein n=1 Tax=Pseudonocardia xinjiangensis TaxID=75289 RepID=A0ABX1RG64_9PSEU|nr:PD-(D/E)XK nuclease family protein [Pseudonocardia xinjiangensis]NMH79383.1 PD-(D/E)XK nuclease family protein [Pseudonocardia xinjiangensis]